MGNYADPSWIFVWREARFGCRLGVMKGACAVLALSLAFAAGEERLDLGRVTFVTDRPENVLPLAEYLDGQGAEVFFLGTGELEGLDAVQPGIVVVGPMTAGAWEDRDQESAERAFGRQQTSQSTTKVCSVPPETSRTTSFGSPHQAQRNVSSVSALIVSKDTQTGRRRQPFRQAADARGRTRRSYGAFGRMSAPPSLLTP